MINWLLDLWCGFRSWRREYPLLRKLVEGLAGTAIIGVGLGFLVFVVTGVKEGYFDYELCFTNVCIANAGRWFSESILIVKGTVSLLVAIATVGGIMVALMSYINNANATALSNHIAHFSVFQSYLAGEIARRDRIAISSVDVLSWYNLIFPTSRVGRMMVSDRYQSSIERINDELRFSNSQATHATSGSFRYKLHQERVIEGVGRLGIRLPRTPRNDFYEIEDQVFSLINCVNSSFCFSERLPVIVKREYV